MKKLVLVLVLLLGAETWGIYGAMQTKRLAYRCTMEVGPLCYWWEESTLASILGVERTKELEKKLLEAKGRFERDYVKEFLDKERTSKAVDKAGAAAKESLEKAGEALQELFEEASQQIKD